MYTFSENGSGSILRNVFFRKVKLGQAVIYIPEDFADFVKEFVPSIITAYVPEAEEIEEPSNIEESPLIHDTLSVHKFDISLIK